jgi:hypothetical protein
MGLPKKHFRNAFNDSNAWRLPTIVSLMVHAFGIGFAVLLFPSRLPQQMGSASTIVLQSAPMVADATDDRTTNLDSSSSNEDALLPDDRDPHWRSVMEVSSHANSPQASTASNFVQSQIDRSIRNSQQRSSEENLDRLKKLGGDLNRNSRSESVQEMAGFLGSLIPKRAVQPVSDSTGMTFDVATAQLHDVQKSIDPNGIKHYLAVMIDAQGITSEIELDEESGEQLYKTIKLIRSNPLLEQVYRKIVMGILDNFLKNSDK